MSKRDYDDYDRHSRHEEGHHRSKRWDRSERSYDDRKRSNDSHGGFDSRIPPPPPPPRVNDHNNSSNGNNNGERQRKRKSRWGDEEKERVFIPGMPTIIPSNLTKEQEEIYLIQLQIESVTRTMASGIVLEPEGQRSPSPEPIYNSEGKRMNTREYRHKKKLEEQRHRLVVKMMELNPNYKPPSDYRPPQTKIFEKVLIPQEEHPDINFVGLIIGPRGNTLKGMERDSQAKIIIRGKGSVKEGKLARKDGQPTPGEDEPLHAFVSGPTHESVAIAVSKIREVIRKGIELPENQNDLRRSQLRELALLNGTLRENDTPRCSNCGSNQHRSWQCHDKPNITNNVFCTNCNGAGHIARDCKEEPVNESDKAKIDEEYMALMAQLGEDKGPANSGNGGGGYGRSGRDRDEGGGGGYYGSSRGGHSSIPQPPPPPPPPPGYGQDSQSSSSNPYDSANIYGDTSSAAPMVEQSDSESSHSAAWANYYAQAGYTSEAYSQAYAGYDWNQYAQWYASAAATGAQQGSSTSAATGAAAAPPPPPPPSYAPPPPPPPPQ